MVVGLFNAFEEAAALVIGREKFASVPGSVLILSQLSHIFSSGWLRNVHISHAQCSNCSSSSSSLSLSLSPPPAVASVTEKISSSCTLNANVHGRLFRRALILLLHNAMHRRLTEARLLGVCGKEPAPLPAVQSELVGVLAEVEITKSREYGGSGCKLMTERCRIGDLLTFNCRWW
uniref:Uncharacterized protein n=1 Tax=Glossina brevipalpis TaxID=37001 RepID=A0A1A9X2H9_9MUSC